MDTYRAVTTRRTIRLFQQKPIPHDLIDRMLDAARLAPSGANRQVVECVVVQESGNREALFEHLAWAGYVRPRRTPPVGKRPTAYIVVVMRESNDSDAAAAMQNMILTAWNEGVGSCWIGSVEREKVATLLSVPESYSVYGVLALGYPAESPMTEVLTDSVKYWLGDHDVLHVPKRRVSDVVHHETFRRE